jgi:threonine/homoserine/homoserine lactone efflux protein
MDYHQSLWLYFTLLFGIIIVPGMDMLFVLANALTGGTRRGLAATSGIMLGGAVHSAYGAAGVGILVAMLPGVFNLLLFAGVAYMIWIGVSLMRSSIKVEAVGPGTARSTWKAFRQGAVTCLVNPKAYIFVLAVYPQFIKPEYGPIWLQGLIMGIMTVLTQLAVYGTLAMTAGRSRDLLLSNPNTTAVIGRLAGLLLVVISAISLWQGWKTA